MQQSFSTISIIAPQISTPLWRLLACGKLRSTRFAYPLFHDPLLCRAYFVIADFSNRPYTDYSTPLAVRHRHKGQQPLSKRPKKVEESLLRRPGLQPQQALLVGAEVCTVRVRSQNYRLHRKTQSILPTIKAATKTAAMSERLRARGCLCD